MVAGDEEDLIASYPVEIARLRAQLARADAVIAVARLHIRSFEPGTLIGSELALANALAAYDLKGEDDAV